MGKEDTWQKPIAVDATLASNRKGKIIFNLLHHNVEKWLYR